MPFARPTFHQRLWGLVLAVLAGLHLHTIVTHEPGWIDVVWSCNMAMFAMTALLLLGFHPALNYAVLFWSAVGAVSWAIFLLFDPSIFRFTSVSSHTLVPALAFYYLRRTGVPPGAWLPTALFGELSFGLLVAFHPERNFLFLFDFDAAPLFEQAVACVLVQLYYAGLVVLAYKLGRRWLPGSSEAQAGVPGQASDGSRMIL